MFLQGNKQYIEMMKSINNTKEISFGAISHDFGLEKFNFSDKDLT